MANKLIDFKSITGNGTDQQCHNRDHDRIAEGVKHRKSQILHVDQGLKILDQIGTRDQPSRKRLRSPLFPHIESANTANDA